MSFYVPKLIWALIEPSTLLLIAFCSGLVLQLTPWRRVGNRLLVAASLIVATVAILPVNSLMVAALESRFPPVRHAPAHVDGIILLGGSFHVGISEARGVPALNDYAERITSFAKLARDYPEAKLVFSGGSGRLTPGFLRESDIAAKLLGELGLDTRRVIFDGEARNTYEHPSSIRRLIKPKPGETWLLVTSAVHMPRAVGVFRKQDWPVTAYPTDYQTLGFYRSLKLGFELGGALQRFDFAMKNWVGLAGYYLLGRTSEFLPSAPEEPVS